MSASVKVRAATIAAALLACLSAPAFALDLLDLNGFRAQHKLPPLSYSATLAGAARSHAQDMAKRNSLDHDGFKERARLSRGAAAENVSYGCDNQDCAIRQWAASSGHRANMLMKGVSAYGVGSAVSDTGRKYWAMMLGN